MLNISGLKLPMIGAHLVGGTVYFVDSSNAKSSSGNTGKHPDKAMSTIAQAEAKCTASKGDYIVALPGHAESVTSTIVLNTAGITLLGIGNGTNRPNLTQATTGNDNVMEIAADNITVENILFTGSTTGTNERFIDIQAIDYCTIRGCRFVQNTKNLDAISVAGPSVDYLIIEDCEFIGIAAGADNGILFENITNSTSNLNPIIRRCHFNYTGSAGADDACINVSHSSGATVGMLIQDCTFLGVANGDAAVNQKGMAATRCTGLLDNLRVLAADATDAFVVSDLMGYINVYAVEAASRPAGAALGSGMAPLLTSAF
ncbi:hypothetical protein LCGC14_1344780 [marine sediment metagenome]|uniref:Right handed beta helix domain-containing protein n=1 Tax=marine sediment metagenome TaxID=412755 RepID=A0A0F9KYW7_9ZZZZ|nr:hypothetical protein [Desulfobacterales bacterium]